MCCIAIFVCCGCCLCCIVSCCVVVGDIDIVKCLVSRVVGVRGMLTGVCVRCAGLLGIVGGRFVCSCSWVVTVCICFHLVCSSDGWLLVVLRSVVVSVAWGAVSFLDVC
jgi:hypothetical protein